MLVRRGRSGDGTAARGRGRDRAGRRLRLLPGVRLLEVQRLAAPHDLAGLTAVYQAVSYLGFGAPFLLAAMYGAVSPAGYC